MNLTPDQIANRQLADRLADLAKALSKKYATPVDVSCEVSSEDLENPRWQVYLKTPDQNGTGHTFEHAADEATDGVQERHQQAADLRNHAAVLLKQAAKLDEA